MHHLTYLVALNCEADAVVHVCVQLVRTKLENNEKMAGTSITHVIGVYRGKDWGDGSVREHSLCVSFPAPT